MRWIIHICRESSGFRPECSVGFFRYVCTACLLCCVVACLLLNLNSRQQHSMNGSTQLHSYKVCIYAKSICTPHSNSRATYNKNTRTYSQQKQKHEAAAAILYGVVCSSTFVARWWRYGGEVRSRSSSSRAAAAKAATSDQH